MGKTVGFVILALLVCVPLIHAENTGNGAAQGGTPGVIVMDGLADQFEPVSFDHSMHQMIAGNCAQCHHQHPGSEEITCSGCHQMENAAFKRSVVNRFLSCSSCHGNPDPATPHIPSLKVAYHRTCFQCHRGIGNLGLDPKACAEMCHGRKPEKVSDLFRYVPLNAKLNSREAL